MSSHQPDVLELYITGLCDTDTDTDMHIARYYLLHDDDGLFNILCKRTIYWLLYYTPDFHVLCAGYLLQSHLQLPRYDLLVNYNWDNHNHDLCTNNLCDTTSYCVNIELHDTRDDMFATNATRIYIVQ